MRAATPRATAGGVALALVLAVVLGACADGVEPTAEPDPDDLSGQLLVSAAASLTDAFGELADDFSDEHPGVTVRLNLAGSATLREQVLAGAPVDVLATADTRTMDAVVTGIPTADDPVVVATNRLQLAVPADNPGDVTRLEDLAEPRLLIGLCAPQVPCGALAREALAAAGVTPSPDTEERDVRALLTRIAAGELDAGLVYASDVLAAVDDDAPVLGIDLPPGADPTTEYPVVALAGAPNPAVAAAFVDFVSSEQGRRVLRDWGFGTP